MACTGKIATPCYRIKQMIVASRNESGMTGPALRAMMGNVNTTLVAGAMCVTAWKTNSESPSELRRS